ncbi:MAG: putative DNA binding domain-containing protein [Oscillospiraceae bacterium]|nr:putative DNA binding domain-containing protein [Oscillospiraceae bacterium]
MTFENESIEYKREYVDDICKEVIAFANTNGGKLLIGVEDSGNPVGLEDIDNTYTRVTNTIRDSISPDVTMFVKYSLSNGIISVEVSEGTAKPYYLKSKGLKPSGVYVRQGASSVPASTEQIRQMIKLSDGDVYETARSLEQDLTFSAAEKVFREHKVDFSSEKYPALGICNLSDNLYTNLAKIISDQCEHTIKIAVFADDNNTVFKAHKEFGGSVFTQLEEAFDYLMLCNQNPSTIVGINRIDRWDYPVEALREALLNAIVHRDYAFSGSIIINVNESCMEFVSLGGLVQGLSADDIKNGISQLRNRNLAEMFHRLNFIESYGTGIRRIFALYSDCKEQPEISVTSNSFKITLPNMNKCSAPEKPHELTAQEQAILDYLDEHDEMTELDVQQLLGVKKTRAFNLIQALKSAQLVEVVGRGTDKKIVRMK